ncbi:MAG: esterase-like activity of phytase family protein [Candidatus Sumerlaeia bacterium]
MPQIAHRIAVYPILVILISALSCSGSLNAVENNSASKYFQKVGTFDVMAGNGSSVAEIVDASRDGRQLIYTDSDNGAIGFVDISNPASPKGLGTVAVEGEPTSLVILDPLVLVCVNTSPDFLNPSGKLLVIDRISRKIVAHHDLGGQPDSLALAPDRQRAAIVLENERDEDLNDGLIPQKPSGKLLIVKLQGKPKDWTISEADLSPVTASAPVGQDLEAEYVDINEENEAVVSFQENNYLAVVDLVSGKTLHHFSAGTVELQNVDTREEGLIQFDNNISRRREPDAVAWLDHDSFASANEGDYKDAYGEEGGARGFTLFSQDGRILFESGERFEHWLASMGHYNEGRSENKGCEPESVEVGIFGERQFLFVGSERCNIVGVYDINSGQPLPVQALPTGIGPEGLKAIPGRDLFVASTEVGLTETGIPAMINIYGLAEGSPGYPMIISANDASGNPIPWVALSGLAAHPGDPNILYAVSDSFLAKGFIYTIDVSEEPARIVKRLVVNGASVSLDLEAIAVGPDGHFWLGSEGNADSRPNLILKVDSQNGAVLDEIGLPDGMADKARKNGIEGIAVEGETGAERLYVALQRAWPREGDTDKVNTKIGRYDLAREQWTFVHYPLEPENEGGWIGLSDLCRLPNGSYSVIERDKGWGSSTGLNAELKAIYAIDLAQAEFRAYDDPRGLVTISKTRLYDLLPRISEASIWAAEKIEGLAVAADGQVYIVSDNDGLDDAPGETLFLNLGHWKEFWAE